MIKPLQYNGLGKSKYIFNVLILESQTTTSCSPLVGTKLSQNICKRSLGGCILYKAPSFGLLFEW